MTARASTRRSAAAGLTARSRPAGFSLVELLISLAISAMLLTATMVAIDVSFKSYASAAEMASAQASTRMVVHRLIQLVRTSTAHGPLLPDAISNPPITLSGDTISSHYIELLDPQEQVIRMEYHADTQELWVTVTPPDGGAVIDQPALTGVTNAQFYAHRRKNSAGLWVLERGTVDLTVEPGHDATLALEAGHNAPIRMIASTMPRRLD